MRSPAGYPMLWPGLPHCVVSGEVRRHPRRSLPKAGKAWMVWHLTPEPETCSAQDQATIFLSHQDTLRPCPAIQFR